MTGLWSERYIDIIVYTYVCIYLGVRDNGMRPFIGNRQLKWGEAHVKHTKRDNGMRPFIER